ncbi:long-chain fatty acid--CoA ligase [Haloprofundus halobius]|uniref:long-chain fatty acid--CoA ligase n=1 Tax=Haloprofundus halobius TaxID=2876194 RepID=UPI001CCC819A|nr:long-chain fatty acid--CoA ligase [Haloprofundus halobius]
MNVLGEIVGRDRRTDRSAVHHPSAGRTMSYHDFCTTAWKAGNVFRHLGVAGGRGVEIEPIGSPESLLSFFGATLLGSPVRFEIRDDDEARLVVATADREAEFDPSPGTKLVVYGDCPTRPDTTYWESDVWSENPAIPPYEIEPSTPALVTHETTYSHEQLLTLAERVVDDYDLSATSRVAVAGSLSHPGVVVAGVVAPLLVGGTAVLGSKTDEMATLAVVTDDETADASSVVDADTVL